MEKRFRVVVDPECLAENRGAMQECILDQKPKMCYYLACLLILLVGAGQSEQEAEFKSE